MSLAICIRCGTLKRNPPQQCSSCGLRPQTDEDKAKSVILSLNYEIDGEYFGKSREELLTIAQEIRNGKLYEFDPEEVAMVIEYAMRVRAIPSSLLLTDLLKWIGPVVLILIAVFVLLWTTK
jgi:hypothetical protein